MSVEQKLKYLQKTGAKHEKAKQKLTKKESVKKEPKPKKEKTKKENNKKKVQTLTGDEDINFNNKEHIVEEFAKRWWYAMPPEWPPKDYDYQVPLKDQKLRRVEVARWKLEPEEDDQGFKKVFELETFIGVFKDSQGQTYDLRPKDTCPSLNNFTRMEKPKL